MKISVMDADLILLDFNQVHLIPCHNILSNLVYAASGHDVALTMVRGKILYADGKFPTLDLPAVMNKTELISEVAKKCGTSKKDAEKAVNATVDAITEALCKGDKVQLVGFGGFETKSRVARMVIGLDNNKINLSIKRTLPVPPRQPMNRGSRPPYDRNQGGQGGQSSQSRNQSYDRGQSRNSASHSSGYQRQGSYQPAQPQPKSFDDMLKQFMTESDSKMSSIKEYSEHRTKTRRR